MTNSAINLFSSSRPITKGRDGLEESWVEKTYFTTEEAFPTVLRRSEIIAVEVIEISPIERVLNDVEQRTKELEGLYARYSIAVKTGQHVSTNPLTMALNTAVDAPQENGVPSFRHFLSNEYIMRNPDKIQVIERLRIGIDDHVCIYLDHQPPLTVVTLFTPLGSDSRHLPPPAWADMSRGNAYDPRRHSREALPKEFLRGDPPFGC